MIIIVNKYVALKKQPILVRNIVHMVHRNLNNNDTCLKISLPPQKRKKEKKECNIF